MRTVDDAADRGRSSAVSISEVGPRDGLQDWPAVLGTDVKVRLVDALTSCGFARVEVTSFVNPKLIPQFADALEVLRRIERRPNVVYSVLVPNVSGMELAVAGHADEAALFVSASETHNYRNVRRSISESRCELEQAARLAHRSGIRLRGYIVTAFGCPFEGTVSRNQVLELARFYDKLGVSEISLGDTTGMANPVLVMETVRAVLDLGLQAGLAVHFHDSRGLALANVFAAWQCGVRSFDSSIGGIGGCPGTPGATGNVASEDLVNMFHEMGIATGVSLGRLLEVREEVSKLLNHPLFGKVHWTGPPRW